jgi:hypothetical protein
MATKPVVSFTFATNANYSSGPQSGNPSKVIPADIPNGFIPAQGIPAAWNNYMFNIAGDWSVWLLAGSDAAGLDAHLVETNSSGYATLAQLTLGGTAAGLQSLVVTQNTGAVSASILASNTSTGFAIAASASDAVAAIRGTNSATGPGVEGLGLGTNNVGVKGTGQGTAAGGQFTGGATGPGITATGGATGDVGALCTGTGAFAGLSAIGGATGSEAVLGTASVGSQVGVHGVTTGAATTAAAGVFGEGLGDAQGGRFTSESGYAMTAQGDSTSPVRASIRVGPQNADPSSPDMGALTHRSDIDIPRVYTDSIWQSPWTTASGHAHGLSNPRTVVVQNGDSTTYVEISTLTMASPYEPRFAGGSVVIMATARFGDMDTTIHHYFIDVQILDVTAGTPVYTDTICTGSANADATVDGEATSQWTVMVPYAIPAAGARVFSLRFKPDSTLGADAVADVASFIAVGVFG